VQISFVYKSLKRALDRSLFWPCSDGRWSLSFFWFGGMKLTAYEADDIAPFIVHSPITSWLHALFGVQGASDVVGVLELSTAVALILGAFKPFFSVLGAAMSAATYLITPLLLLEHARRCRSDGRWISSHFGLAWPVSS
jgi:hypothetical protein